MWIVRLALNRPYTFIVMALLILLASPVVIQRTPTDIFPNINIPVVAVAWQFTGLNPEEMEGRFTTGFERILTTVVDNIEHIESTTINGQSIIKVFLQPDASLAIANAQITAVSQGAPRQLPAGAQPPLILNFSASTVPIVQLALSGEGLSEQPLHDIGLTFSRTTRARPCRPACAFRRRSVRTAAQRHRPEFFANPARHGARGCGSLSLRRQTNPSDDRSKSSLASIERPVGHRRGERSESAEPGTAFGHRQDRSIRVSRRSSRRSTE